MSSTTQSLRELSLVLSRLKRKNMSSAEQILKKSGPDPRKLRRNMSPTEQTLMKSSPVSSLKGKIPSTEQSLKKLPRAPRKSWRKHFCYWARAQEFIFGISKLYQSRFCCIKQTLRNSSLVFGKFKRWLTPYLLSWANPTEGIYHREQTSTERKHDKNHRKP